MRGMYDRSQDLAGVRSQLYRLLDEFAAAPALPGREAAGKAAPAVDIEAGRDQVVITAEVPGLARDELDVRVHGETVTISGRARAATDEGERLLRAERPRTAFERSFALPWAIDPDGVQAKLERGILALTVSRAAGKEG
jgi:HSP20 family protein